MIDTQIQLDYNSNNQLISKQVFLIWELYGSNKIIIKLSTSHLEIVDGFYQT